MLDRQSNSFAPAMAPYDHVVIGLPELLAFLRRQFWPIAVGSGVFLLLGVAYLAITPPIYSASSTLLIDPRKVSIFGSGSVLEDASISNSGLETQVQVLESGRIARAVVDRLDLSNNVDFMRPAPASAVAVVKRAISELKTSVLGDESRPPPAAVVAVEAGVPSSLDPAQRAAGIVASRLSASRVGLSYVISVTYRSTDPVEAAQLANAGAEAYLDDQVAAQVEAAEQASEWLQERLTDLQNRAANPLLGAQEKSAVRATYDSFLERYTQTVQQQSLPFANVRILTEATVPSDPTSPNGLIVALGAIVVGGGLGFCVGLGRELLDRSVKTPAQVEAATGAPFLGFLPIFETSGRIIRRSARRARRQIDVANRQFVGGGPDAVVISSHNSRYAETLRGVRVAVEGGGGRRERVVVLGIVSAMPGEGRSRVASNLARLVAAEGGRVILLDGDVRDPDLSRSLVGPDRAGLAEIADGQARIADVIWGDKQTRLQFVPAGQIGDRPASSILAAPATRALIEACRQQFDLVVIDLPAVSTVVDIRAAAHLFDGFLMVAEWGKTGEDILFESTHRAGIEGRLLGTILNKVNLKLLKRHVTGGQRSWV